MKQIHLDQCNTEQDIVYAIYEIQRSLQLSSTIKRVLTMPYNLVNYDMKYNFEQFLFLKIFINIHQLYIMVGFYTISTNIYNTR